MNKISSTLKCQMVIEERKKNGLEVYNFGLGANPLKPNTKYIECLKLWCDKNEYTSPFGIEGLQLCIKDFMHVENYNIDKVLFGNGLKELIYVLQSVFNGIIVHITPAWVSYKGQLKILGKLGSLREFETNFDNGYKIDCNRFNKFLEEIHNENLNKKIIVIFNNPCNPTGVVYTEDEVKEIANICRKNNVVVFADEIYMNLVYDIDTCSIAKYYPEGVIRGSSLSKDIGCGGHRLGWLTFPNELNDLMLSCNSYISSMYSCPSTTFQYGILDFFNKHDIYEFNKICQNTKNIFRKIIKDVVEILDKTKIKYIRPGFAWYLFLDFENYRDFLNNKGVTNSEELADYFMDEGVISVNGKSFGCDKLSVRLSLVDITYKDGYIDHSNIMLGIVKLIDLIK